jgi:taurine dioxygenase
MALKVSKLSYALGAEVSGVDISKPLDKATVSEIYAAFLEHYVLVFRGQTLTREQHIAFSRYFGELNLNEGRGVDRWHPDYPELFLVISRPTPTGEAATGRHTGADWHTDNSHWPVAAQASLLRAIEIPGMGGDTMFCDMYRAYETLSDGMKNLIEGLHGIHMVTNVVLDHSSPEKYAESRKRFPAAAHPVVRVHPDTGRKALYVNVQVRHFVGMTAAESKPLIRYLTNHATHPQNVYRHQWRKDDLVMWDNRCLLHMALVNYDRRQIRHMERTTVNAEKSGYVYEGPLDL